MGDAAPDFELERLDREKKRTDGVIAFAGDEGPRGFDPEAWVAAIKQQTG